MCSPLPEPTNGAIRYVTSESDSPPYELGTIAEYTCDIGYGFPVSGVVPVSAICQSDAQSLNGEWIGAQLTCSRECSYGYEVYLCIGEYLENSY